MSTRQMVIALLFLAFLAFLAFFADSAEAQQGQNVNEESNFPQGRSGQMTLYQTTTNTPSLMSYIGHLADAAGNPITASTNVAFSIYALATGGTALWSETHNIIPSSTGTFGVALGSITPISSKLFKDNSNLYLGVKVANDAEMSPRQMITSAAFAFSAEVASLREGYGDPVSTGTANASGTATTLARSDHVHQGLRSINGLFGDVTLRGSGIYVTTSGQSIEIGLPDKVRSIGVSGSPALFGDVTLSAEANEINLSQSGSTITIGIADPLIVSKGGTGTSAQFTQGSVVFAGASGVYSQNNSNLFWNNTNNRFGIGTANPGSRLTTRYDAAPVSNDEPNTLRLERGDAGYDAGDPGSQIVFAQRWWAGNNDIIRTGGIRGIKTAANAFFGGGLQLLYQPDASGVDMLVGVTLNGSGNVGIGTASPEFPLHVNATVTTSYNNYGALRDNSTPAVQVSGNSGNVGVSIRTLGRILAGGEVNALSDQRLKDLVDEINPSVALEAVTKLKPLHFTWKKETNKGDQVIAGFFAQEVAQAIPDAVIVYKGDILPDEHFLNYNILTTYALAAIQEQQLRLEEQQKIIAAQQKQIESLQAEIKAIRESLTSASGVVGLRK